MRKIKFLATLLCFLTAVGISEVWGGDETYTWTLANNDLGTTNAPATSVTKGEPSTVWNIAWTWYDSTKKYLGFSGGTSGKGVQVGKGSADYGGTVVQLSTSAIKGTITTVVVNGSVASSGTGNVTVTVNDTPYQSDKSTSASLTTSATDYTFTGECSGTITVTYTNTSTQKAMYIKSISVTYENGSATQAAAPALTEPCTFTTSTYDVTITNKESGASVYYTTDDTDPTTSSSSFTGESKTIQISATTTVKAMAVVSGKDNSSVTSAKYTYEKSIANTEETAYTTAEAIALIDANSTQLTTTAVYVKGIISKIDILNANGSLNYWLDENAFEVYYGWNIDSTQFSATTDLQAGDTVVVKGKIKRYNTTNELDKYNVLISRKPSASAKQNQTVTLGTYKTVMTTTDAADSYTAATDGDGALSVESSNPGVATATISDGFVTVTPVAVGTTTITVTAAETDNYNEGSKSYTLTVTGVANLPFSFNGGKADIDTTAGMSQSGLGTDYKSSPKLKFDGTGDYLVICFNSAASTLSYTIKGNGSNSDPWSGRFDVLESVDGAEYTSVQSYPDNLSSEAIIANLPLKGESRYVKFVYTTKTLGNVALGAISISADKPEPTMLDQTQVQGEVKKILINGQLYIRRDGKTYNAIGTRVE